MMMNFKGSIRTSKKRLYVNKEECLGITTANKDKFSIIISDTLNKNIVSFMEVLLHEMFHLYFFILSALSNKELEEAKQHKIINKAVPYVLNKIATQFRTKKSSNVKNTNKRK